MPVKIRLQRRGRKKRPFYHIVIADSRSPRDGRFIEKIGVYNPMTNPATIDVDRQKALDWIGNVRKLVVKRPIMGWNTCIVMS